MAETQAEAPTPAPKPPRFDGNDLQFYAGLILLGTGLAFAISWPVALAAVGGVLVLVAVASAFFITKLSRD